VRHRVLAVLRGLPQWMRSVSVATALLGVVSVAAAVSTPSSRQHPPSRRATAPDRTTLRSQVPAHAPALAHSELAPARQAAVRFLASYLRFAFGRARAQSVAPVSQAVRHQLMRGGASVTPVERRRHPHVMSVQVVAGAAGLAHATALVEDGGVTSYAVRVTLRRQRSGWVVTAIGR
jgi:hypothetical protein